ncbi:hypothetical protein K504DRAFT_537732 [Pleomassaria siparia CBS 279.74]|uniref:Ubiquitin 3 binding protein But2 C-terminal domain-containing protein n=1 Tax=Pleomassaria siparia CBS 279.74 TaxID=1314801 RepID=A0A6G1JVY8_9PLEO|nr:hypothetical protein K504DRAFT_537732 [Pleomassaria siparia CBS 279.74]
MIDVLNKNCLILFVLVALVSSFHAGIQIPLVVINKLPYLENSHHGPDDYATLEGASNPVPDLGADSPGATSPDSSVIPDIYIDTKDSDKEKLLLEFIAAPDKICEFDTEHKLEKTVTWPRTHLEVETQHRSQKPASGNSTWCFRGTWLNMDFKSRRTDDNVRDIGPKACFAYQPAGDPRVDLETWASILYLEDGNTLP